MRHTLRRHQWLWVVFLLLALAAVTGRRLNTWSIQIDEAATMMSAGARNFGPLSLAESLEFQHSRWPDQAFGWVLVVNLWGNVVGWTTVAVRALSWFAGLLTLALLYRAGRGMFSQHVALYAALLLATSVFFAIYLHNARAFTLVALLATLTLWCYWRCALRERPPGRGSQAGLLLGGIGLLYAHYFAALLLPALGLYHLFFVRRGRHWWRVVLLFALIALSALPELEVLGSGIEFNMQRYGPGRAVLSIPSSLVHLLHTLTNRLLNLPQVFGPLLLLLLAASALLLIRQRRSGARLSRASHYLGMVALLFLTLALMVNEVVQVLMKPRMRYLMALWPPLTLLTACGIWQLGRRRQRLADSLLVALVASGIMMNPFYQNMDSFRQSNIHLADQALVVQARSTDFLLLDERVLPAPGRILEYYSTVLDFPREILKPDDFSAHALERALTHSRVWLLAAGRGSALESELAGAMVFCRRPLGGHEQDMTLTLYARAEDECP